MRSRASRRIRKVADALFNLEIAQTKSIFLYFLHKLLAIEIQGKPKGNKLFHFFISLSRVLCHHIRGSTAAVVCVKFRVWANFPFVETVKGGL